MISSLRGILIEIGNNYFIVDVNGIGYEIQCSTVTQQMLPNINEIVTCFIYFLVREDNQSLYGFSTKVERNVFKQIIKVNGIGPRLAITILSHVNVQELTSIIKNNDIARLAKIPGIGNKLAQRMTIELKNLTELAGEIVSHTNDYIRDSIDALIALGYKPLEARQVVHKYAKDYNNSASLIKHALGILTTEV